MMRSVLASVFASVLLIATSPPTLAQITFNASIWMPPNHPLARTGYVEWAKALEAATNGQLKAQVFTGSSLLPPNAHLSGLQDGIAEVTYHTGTYTPSELPEDNVLSTLSIGLPDMMVAGFAVSDFYMTDPQMQARFEALGIVFTGAQSTPQYNLFCTKPVKKLADLKGLKIRMPGVVHAEWARSVGAVPVSIPSSEMFTGLERGQLDCVANAANDLKSRSIWDVAKFTNLVALGPYTAGWMWAFNKSFWARLNEQHRRTIMDLNAKYLVASLLDYENVSKEALHEAPSHGVTVLQPDDDLVASVEQFAQNQAHELALKEAARLGANEPEELIKRFKETVKKWDGLLAGIDRTDSDKLEKVLKENLYDTIDVRTYGN